MMPAYGRSTKPRYAQVASNLDSNPKIRKAGNLGRQVFEFALRRNAEPGNQTPGRLPSRVMEAWFLADQLMLSVSDCDTGLSRAVEADLLVRQGEFWAIVGWEDHWGERPLEGSERMKKWRENNKTQDTDDLVTESDAPNVTRDACDALDKIRRDKKEELPGKPDVLALAEFAVAEINRFARTAYRADSKTTLQQCKILNKLGVTSEQIRTVICARKEWLSDDKMAQYFRPSTLLRPSKVRACLEDLEARKPVSREATPDEPPELSHLVVQI